MSSRIKKVHTDCLAALKTVKNPFADLKKGRRSDTLFSYINIYDNQIDELILGETCAFGMPSVFIEIVLGNAMQLGQKMTSYPETMIRLHLVNTLLDGSNNSMEQNLEIFNVRDLTKAAFFNTNISFCSSVVFQEELLDYKHKNLYKYILGFKTNFIDSKGSILDDESGATFGYLANPTLNLNIFKVWVSEKIYLSNILIGGDYVSQDLDYYVSQDGQTFGSTDGRAYTNLVSYQNNIYICSVSNNDKFFDPTKWIIVTPWFSKKFVIGDYCAFNQHIYICKTDNVDLVFTPSNWNYIL